MREPLFSRLFLSWISKRAHKIAKRGGPDLEALERYMRSPSQLDPADIFGNFLERTLARLACRLDLDGFLHSLRRGHYRAVSRAGEPVLRFYKYRGFDVLHDIRNKSQWNAYVKAIHQPGITHWIRQRLPVAGVGMDIGANAGVLSLEMASRVGDSGMVYAFEPNPEAYRLLEKAIAENGLKDRLLLCPYGLGAREESVILSIPAVNNGAAAMREPYPGEESMKSSVVGFEAWWAEQGRISVDFIKVDVEGYEQQVLPALRPALVRDRPYLVFEVDPAAYDLESLLDQLLELDYSLYEILHRAPFYQSLEKTPVKKMDLLAVRPAGEGP